MVSEDVRLNLDQTNECVCVRVCSRTHNSFWT